MRLRGQVIIGSILVFIGLISLASLVFRVDIWAYCWPIALIVLGVWLLARPQFGSPDRPVRVVLLGEVRRRGDWHVTNQEIWLGVGDIELDFGQAHIPEGETEIHVHHFVGDIKVYVPRDVGIRITSNAFVSDSVFFGSKQDNFLTTLDRSSDGYNSALYKIHIESLSFVSSIKVREA